ncbi:Fcf2 pre-rRNA processing-domain-containing protein [Pavlovales sp. CCMP2436]|nr:Fcf2 pre-rRNA processing-domain-containing protein [Pavlovales sp. CCMP2436]
MAPRSKALEPLLTFGSDGIASLAKPAAGLRRPTRAAAIQDGSSSTPLNAFDTRPVPVAGKRQPVPPSTKWFEIGKAEMTQALKDELNIVAMMGVVDPKKFTKRSDYKKGKLPTNVQIGTVVQGAAEGKSGRLTKKERRPTMVAEMMADESVRKYAKRKFMDVQHQAARGGKADRKAKVKARRPSWTANRH